MNKKVLVTVAVLLFLGIGAYGSYRVYKHFKRLAATPGTQTTQTADTQGSAASSLKDLLTKGVAQSCTYTSDAGSGTVFVSGAKVRGDFDTTAGGQTSKSHMIVMDNTSYIWTEGQKVGFKMSFDASATPVAGASGNTSAQTKTGFDPSAMNNYKCGAWVVDSTMFDLPKDVTFSTFAMPGGSTPATGTGTSTKPSTTDNSSQCAYCNALSGSDKTQCLAALNCK